MNSTIKNNKLSICPFCKSSKIKTKRKILSKLNNKEYEEYFCFDCGIYFFTPLIFENVYDNEKMGAYKDFHVGRKEYPDWTKKMLNIFAEKKINLKDKKILEIGLGDGINFLALKKSFGIISENFFGVEFDKKSIEICKERGIINITEAFFNKDILEKINSRFDVIILTEVFEHQTDPKNFIETVFHLLKPDGIVIITVPNNKRLFLRFREYGDIPPHHFLRFNKDFFRKNFKEEIIYLDEYSFKNKNLIDSSKALSLAILGNRIFFALFFPVVSILRIIDFIWGEGLITIIRKRYNEANKTILKK